MQARLIGVVLAAGLAMAATAMPALAQSPLDGPLASPDATPPAVHATTPHAKSKPRKLHHAAAKGAKVPGSESDAAVPRPTSAEAPSSKTAPGDAVDLGMKWNGSNDGSAQTKFQSGPNTSPGSGAEVGMKLHF